MTASFLPRKLAALALACTVAFVEVAIAVFCRWLLVTRFHLDSKNFQAWTETTPPVEVLAALACLVCFLLAAGMAFSTLLYAGGELAQSQVLMRLTARTTLHVVKNAFEQARQKAAIATASSLATTAILSSGAVPAAASPPPPPQYASVAVTEHPKTDHGTTVDIEKGDYLIGIAQQSLMDREGSPVSSETAEEFLWEVVLPHPQNTEFRPNPDRIYPGQRVFIPRSGDVGEAESAGSGDVGEAESAGSEDVGEAESAGSEDIVQFVFWAGLLAALGFFFPRARARWFQHRSSFSLTAVLNFLDAHVPTEVISGLVAVLWDGEAVRVVFRDSCVEPPDGWVAGLDGKTWETREYEQFMTGKKNGETTRTSGFFPCESSPERQCWIDVRSLGVLSVTGDNPQSWLAYMAVQASLVAETKVLVAGLPEISQEIATSYGMFLLDPNAGIIEDAVAKLKVAVDNGSSVLLFAGKSVKSAALYKAQHSGVGVLAQGSHDSYWELLLGKEKGTLVYSESNGTEGGSNGAEERLVFRRSQRDVFDIGKNAAQESLLSSVEEKESDPHVKVSVLGPVRVTNKEGAALSLDPNVQLLFYIVLGPRPVQIGHLAELFGLNPDLQEHQTKVRGRLTRLRRTLQLFTGDQNSFVVAVKKNDLFYGYEPTSEVGTDLDVFLRRVAVADTALANSDLSVFKQAVWDALELVRGVPWSGLPEDWNDTWIFNPEDERPVSIAEIEEMIVRLVRVYVKNEMDHDAAVAVLTKGLLGCPWDQGLWELRIGVCDTLVELESLRETIENAFCGEDHEDDALLYELTTVLENRRALLEELSESFL